ncbi:uncharacterized protein LOC142559805 [Dermacentor variabilis]|uniref:uncharacterized protein LOC142559805 n=1 Tax=Dermacentor variabilis TaxID=34621 RepID=UPI003F5C36F6
MTSLMAKVTRQRCAFVLLGAILLATVSLSASTLDYARAQWTLRSSSTNWGRVVADYLLGEASETLAATGNVTRGKEDGAPCEKLRMTRVFGICGKDYPLGRVAIRPAVANSTTPLQIIVIADKRSRGMLLKEVLKLPQFKGASATSKFIRTFDHLLDLCRLRMYKQAEEGLRPRIPHVKRKRPERKHPDCPASGAAHLSKVPEVEGPPVPSPTK